MIRSTVTAIVVLAGGTLSRHSVQDESLRAAAQLTGLTAGMAAACKLKTTPVLHAFRDLMDRKHVQGASRKRLVTLVSSSHDRGFATQQKPGAMSCTEVQAEVRRTIRRLQRAK